MDLNSTREEDRAFIALSDIIKSNKNFFSELLDNYQPLLAEQS